MCLRRSLVLLYCLRAPHLAGEVTRHKTGDTAEFCCVPEAQETSFECPIYHHYLLWLIVPLVAPLLENYFPKR